MTPASLAPTVAQLNAEALSALAYTQVIRKGTPAIHGHYLATVSMKSGAPMAGTPEISLMNMMIGQMARYYDVPWRTSNTLGGSKVFDAQAGYESATTLMAVMMAGANYIWQSAGWNEAGMHCSMAKFLVDAEQCAMAYRMAEGAVETPARGLVQAKKLLRDYEEPRLDPAKDEALRDYIARREREIPAADALNQSY